MDACFEVPQSICLQGSGGTNFVVTPNRVPADLTIWYQFDKILPLDETGHGNHLAGPDGHLSKLSVGPGIMGRGGSAAFDGKAYGVVPSSQAMETESFAVALWLYLREDSVGSWRTVFRKGEDAEAFMPALLLWPDERRLQVRVKGRASRMGGVLNGAGLLPLRRWTHVAVTCVLGGALRLYVNGAKDGEVIMDGPRALGAGDLFIGRDPWRAGVKAYLDDFRWYGRALSTAEVRALVYPSLTGAAADFVHLGCTSCKFTEAARSCGSRTHLCSLQELFSGGFHAARAMGWLSASPEVWYNGGHGEDHFSDVRKMGLCCSD